MESLGISRGDVGLLLSACATRGHNGRRGGRDSNKSGEVISRLETYRGKRSRRNVQVVHLGDSGLELSSSSGSIPSLHLALFNSRPQAKNRDDTRVAPINNPPAIVPANLFLFIPDLIPGLTRSPVGESRRRGEGINDGYVGYFSDLEILRFFAGYPSSSNFPRAWDSRDRKVFTRRE